MNWQHFLPIIGGPIALSDYLADYQEGEIELWQLAGLTGGLVAIHLWETHHVLRIAMLTPLESNYILARGMMTKKALWEKGIVPAYRIATSASTAGAAALAVPFTVLAEANRSVIEDAPEEEQKGLWQMFSSGLTGTFGIGSGLNL